MASRIPTNFINASTTESPESMAATAQHFGMDMQLESITEGDGGVTQIDSKTGKPVVEESAAEKPEPESKEKEAESAVKETPVTEVVAPKEEAKEEPSTDDDTEETAKKPKQTVESTDVDLSDEDRVKHKKLLKQVDKLTGRLRTEEDKSGNLSRELESLKAQVAELSKTAPVQQQEQQEIRPPERPKRPKLQDFAYDQEKYESALDTYESKLDEYETKREQFVRDQAVRQVREDQAKQAAEDYAKQRQQEWNEAKAEYPGIDEKLADSTGLISPAMQAVLREVYDAKEAWALLDYLADNPEESTRITYLTLSPNVAAEGKVAPEEFAFLSAKATRELAKLESKMARSKAAKDGAAAKKAEPAPTLAPVKATPVSASTSPPAVQKPPVSKAEPPITPVAGRADATGTVDLASDQIAAADYMAARAKQVAERRMRRGV